MNPEYAELLPSDLVRIGGFLGCAKGEFAAKLGVSSAYLSRIINGKNPLSVTLEEKAMELLAEHIKNAPGDKVVQAIRDLSLKYMPKEQALSETWLRSIWEGYSKEDFETLSQRRRSIVNDLKKTNKLQD